MIGIALSSAPIGSMYPLEIGNCGSIGRSYTCAQVEDIVRSRTDTEHDDRLTSQFFLDIINQSCDDLKERMGFWRRYVCWARLGVGTSFDLSSIAMRGIKKVVDDSAGLAILVSSQEYERVGSFSVYDNALIGYHLGETLVLAYGSNLTQGSVKLYYYRNVVQATKRTDKPDIPDEYITELVDAVTQQVMEYKRYGKP